MLTLGANSTCDVCLEHFGADHKAPYSIYCGHVFCFDCIRRVSPPECPLCRTPYLPGKWMKLHVDLAVQSPTSAEKEARRLQGAIGEVTTLGSSETNLRQLINECRGFLQAQPRSMYSDLRVAYRMLSYLYEVKTDLRTQSAAVEALKTEIAQLATEKEELEDLQHLKNEVAQLEADKSQLLGRLAASQAARDKDKQFATDLESRLNEYVTRSESSFQSLSHYHTIIQEYANLNEELKELRSKVLDHAKSAAQMFNPEVLPQSSLHGIDEDEYSSISSASPDSYTPSLHELADRSSPPFIGPFTAAPEARMEHRHQEEVYSRRRLNRCDAEDHIVSCHCGAPSSSPSPPLPSKRSNIPKPAFIIEHVGTVRRRDSVSTAPERQSGLSRSAPKKQESAQALDHTRVRSFSDVSPIPTPPPSSHQNGADDDSRPPSEPASRSASPEHGVSMNPRRKGSPQVDTDNVRRLYSILQKPISSSPPELTPGLNSARRPRHNSSRSPSCSPPGSTATLQVTPAAAQLPVANSYQQPVLPQPPTNVISRASDAAMAIEKSQKEKALKEREREKERQDHRKSDKDADGDRGRPESERAARKQSSGTTTAASVAHAPQTSSYHTSGLPGSPHRDTYTPAQPANSIPQKTSGTSSSTLGRSNSVKVPPANYSQRDGNTSHPPHPFRHGSGSNKSTSGTVPITV